MSQSFALIYDENDKIISFGAERDFKEFKDNQLVDEKAAGFIITLMKLLWSSSFVVGRKFQGHEDINERK